MAIMTEGNRRGIGVFLSDLNNTLIQNTQAIAGVANQYSQYRHTAEEAQDRLDTQAMQIQLESDINEKMLELSKRTDYENFDNEISSFLQEKRQLLGDREHGGKYYARNDFVAETFDHILGNQENAVKNRVLQMQWNQERADRRQKFSDSLQSIMNKSTDDEYTFDARNNEGYELICTALQAGLITRDEADKYGNEIYSENLQAQSQEALFKIWQDNPKLTESQAREKATQAIKAGKWTDKNGNTHTFDIRTSGTFNDYYTDRMNIENSMADVERYEAEHIAFERASSMGEKMIEPAAPTKPQTRAEKIQARVEWEAMGDEEKAKRLENGEVEPAEVANAFDQVDNSRAIENGGIVAIKAIEQAQREQNDRRINQNEEITTAYYKALTKEGGMKEGDFRDLSNQIDRQIQVLEAETNYSMDANDKRARIRELYLLKKGLQEGKAYNSARAGGGGQKEKSMSYPTFANQKIDFALRAVDDGTMSAQQAYTFTRDITFNAAMNNAGEIGETFSYNGKEFANLTDEEKLTVWQETTDTGLVSRLIDETTKALRKNTEFAPLFAKFDKLNAAIKKDPDKYSPEALARLGEVMNSILWTAKGDGSEDQTALCNQLQQAYDGFYLNEAENRLVPKLDGKGNIEMPNINFDATSASAKEVGEVIKLLEDNGAYTYTNPQNNKQMFVTPQTEERIKDYNVDLKDIVAANLNVDSDSLTPLTHYKDGKPDLIPQFRGDDGKIYELRSVTNDKGNATGFEIYDVTGGKEERIDFNYTTPRQRNKQKQHDAQEEKKKAKSAVNAEAQIKSAVEHFDSTPWEVVSAYDISAEKWQSMTYEQKHDVVKNFLEAEDAREAEEAQAEKTAAKGKQTQRVENAFNTLQANKKGLQQFLKDAHITTEQWQEMTDEERKKRLSTMPDFEKYGKIK